MSFLDHLFHQLEHHPDRAAIDVVRGSDIHRTDGRALLTEIARARAHLAEAGVRPGDRVALLAANGPRWVAADLAALALGAVAVPLYDQQAPAELVRILRDAQPALLVAGTDALADAIRTAWPDGVAIVTFDALFAGPSAATSPPAPRADDDPVAIVYTSGTSGEPKGVILTAGGFGFTIPRTIDRLEAAVPALPDEPADAPDRVYHFLPLCFAASRMMLWTQLSRPNPIVLSSDPRDLARELGTVRPHYFLTVPMILERIRAGVDAKVRARGAAVTALYARGLAAAAGTRRRDRWVARLADRLVFRGIRQAIGPALRLLISGSAPLAEDTQRWFAAIGLPVLQAYGLTETTGIVTLDVPGRVVPGKVGIALPGVETRLTDAGELAVRGPNLFAGYWRRPADTAAVVRDGWFHTGDLVEIDADGNHKIVGRSKNLIVPQSGHNIAPEPLEERFLAACAASGNPVSHCLVVGHARPYVAVVVPPGADGARPDPARVDQILAPLDAELPRYRRIKRAIFVDEPFTAVLDS
ncbi:MAG: AMP-binding protein, partial [Myxococcota bacterium]